MSSTPAIGSKPIQSTYLPANALAGGKAAGAQTATASGAIPAQLRVVEPVAPAADTVSLSKQSLAHRAGALGKDTLDLAQQFLSNFARKLFGDAAKGAALSFESAELSTSSSYTSSATVTSGPQGTTRSATLDASESASFIGKGQITTADGQSFEFEIEVHYEAHVEAQLSQTTARPALAAPDALALTGRNLPAIEFPGSLDDLFKLLGRELQLSVPHGEADEALQGNLSLRLLRLVNTAALLAPRAQPDDVRAPAAERNRALAKSYVEKPAQTDIAEA
jgi:hypothetical protein